MRALSKAARIGLLGFAMLVPCASAEAQTAEDKAAAERLFHDGMSLMERSDYEGACPKFAESLRLDSGLGVMLHLADCYAKLGRSASAWGLFREAAELADKQGDARAAVARTHAAALEPTLSTLTITVAVEEQGLTITRDGVDVGRAQWGLAIPVDPGPHAIAASAPGRKTWQETTHVPGEHATVTLTVPALDADTGAPGGSTSTSTTTTTGASTAGVAPVSSGLSAQRIVAIAAAGAGVVALGLGTYFGLHAGAQLSDSNAGGNCLGDHCNDAGTAARNGALGSATASTVFFVVGAAAVAGGAVLWLTAPRPQAARVGVSGVSTGRDTAIVLRGTF